MYIVGISYAGSVDPSISTSVEGHDCYINMDSNNNNTNANQYTHQLEK